MSDQKIIIIIAKIMLRTDPTKRKNNGITKWNLRFGRTSPAVVPLSDAPAQAAPPSRMFMDLTLASVTGDAPHIVYVLC